MRWGQKARISYSNPFTRVFLRQMFCFIRIKIVKKCYSNFIYRIVRLYRAVSLQMIVTAICFCTVLFFCLRYSDYAF